VQVRVYSLNEELRKSKRTVTLTFVVSFSLTVGTRATRLI